MSTTKPILLICGCRKYEDYLHAAIKRMSRPEWDVIGIRGGGETVSFDEGSRILTLDIVDTYEALPAKLHAAYTWIHVNRPGIPGIFKTDDDMLFDLPALAATVAANTTIPYWGVTYSICQAAPVNNTRIMNRFDDKTLTPSHQSAVYCFGAGYWLSSGALLHVVAASADYKGSALEDVCTGFVLNRAGIVPQKIPVSCKEVPRVPQLLALL
jgi:hypothetical protein